MGTNKKPFLILQLRIEDSVSDSEYHAFLRCMQVSPSQTHRIRMEREGLPPISLDDYSAVIIGGGAWNIGDPPEKKSPEQKDVEQKLSVLMREIVARDFPFFGVCYGFGALTVALGVPMSRTYGEPAGAIDLTVMSDAASDPLCNNFPKTIRAFVGHKESATALPPSAVLMMSSQTCPYQMYRVGHNVYAVQFHPEMDADELCSRMDVYKFMGYFKLEDAEKIKAEARKEILIYPMELMHRFAERYCG